MALRHNNYEDKKRGRNGSGGFIPVLARPTPKTQSRMEEMKFSVVMTAKYSISTAEILRHVANETHRHKALLNNLDHAVAERKCVSVLYLSLGAAARKTFMGKYPNAKIAEITLEELLTNCKETFDTKKETGSASYHVNKRRYKR